jgi:hypothetical protein
MFSVKIHEILEKESRLCFDFFWNEANVDPQSPGYGMIRDRAPGAPGIASIASVGFGLTALTIGVERKWISRMEGYQRALGTLKTLYENAQQLNGFYYHFLRMDNGKRALESEVTIIDTAIVICGALSAGEYFGDEVLEIAWRIFERVNWGWYRDPLRNQFYMGYLPEEGFSGWWDFYAEQLMAYILGSASPTYHVKGDMFYDFMRHYRSYGSYTPFIHSWFGSLFTHQFTHAWFNLKDKTDREGVDWWTNSILATLANRQYCIDNAKNFKTFGQHSWGLTACDGPWGYNGRYGASPSSLNNDEHIVDGTVPPAGAAGSIVFTPEESMDVISYLYRNYPDLWGRYGFKDAYNLDVPGAWFARDVIGINKGITLLMIENYRTGFVWEYFMRNYYVKKGMELVGLRKAAKKTSIA